MTATDSVTQIPVRLDFDTHADGFARAMAHLDRAATKELDKVDFDPRLRELARIRASQLNGCAYCIDMHTKDARAIGEAEQRIYALPAWREAPFYTSRERAALAFTEAVTLLASTHVPDDAYPAPTSPDPGGDVKPRSRGCQPAGPGATRITSRVRGPCTPWTRSSSMSLVADGPLIQVSGRAGSSRASASGTSATTWPACTMHRW
jgi:AhpD family alkylhydroperoxidase